jgi:hypothetical protein
VEAVVTQPRMEGNNNVLRRPASLEDDMATKPKAKNPQDATLRNINALKKRCKKLEDRLKALETRVGKGKK